MTTTTTKNKPNPALTTADKLAEAEATLRTAADNYAKALRAVALDLSTVSARLDEAATVAESDNVISLPDGIKPGTVVVHHQPKSEWPPKKEGATS